MPGYDRTGPLGQGALTGRGFGPCGRGFGFRMGFGRGFGFRRFARITEKEEKELLQEELGEIEEEKKEIEKRLKEIK